MQAIDALNVHTMNLGPGGKQPAQRDTVWNGAVQKLVFPDGTPKGARQIAVERGLWADGMKLDDVRAVLEACPDFRDEKSAVEMYLEKRGHLCYFIPKCHPELNFIERAWAVIKRALRKKAGKGIRVLRANMDEEIGNLPLWHSAQILPQVA